MCDSQIIDRKLFSFPVYEKDKDYILIAYLDKKIPPRVLLGIHLFKDYLQVKVGTDKELLIINKKHISEINHILSNLLANDISFTDASYYDVEFTPNDGIYNEEMAELKFIQKQMEFLKSPEMNPFQDSKILLSKLNEHFDNNLEKFADASNYQTNEGKFFAACLKLHLQKK